MLLRALTIWLLLLIVAVLNGAVREAFIMPRSGEHGGHIGQHGDSVLSDYSRCVVFDVLDRTGERTRGFSNRDVMGRADGRFRAWTLRFRQQLGEINRGLQPVSRPHLGLGAYRNSICSALGVLAEARRVKRKS